MKLPSKNKNNAHSDMHVRGLNLSPQYPAIMVVRGNVWMPIAHPGITVKYKDQPPQ